MILEMFSTLNNPGILWGGGQILWSNSDPSVWGGRGSSKASLELLGARAELSWDFTPPSPFPSCFATKRMEDQLLKGCWNSQMNSLLPSLEIL